MTDAPQSKSVTQLTGLTVAEVSPCGVGANNLSRIVFFKSADDPPAGPATNNEDSMTDTTKATGFTPCPDCKTPDACKAAGMCAASVSKAGEALTAIATFGKTLGEAVNKAVESTDAVDVKTAAVNKACDVYKAGVAPLLPLVSDAAVAKAAKVEQFAKGLNEAVPFADQLAATTWDREAWRIWNALDRSVESALLDPAITDKSSFVATAVTGFATAAMALINSVVAKSGGGDPTTTDVNKETPPVTTTTTPGQPATFDKSALPVEVQKHLEGLEAIAKANEMKANEAVAKANEAIEKANAADAKRELVELAKSAETTYPNLPATGAELAPVLKAIGGLDPAVKATIEKCLTAGNEAMGKLFAPVGVNKGGDATDPMAQINKAAAEIAKNNPSMTPAVAFTKACEANPDLYAKLNS